MVFRFLTVILILCGSANIPVAAQSIEPTGSFVSVGLTGLNGFGADLGFVNVGDFFSREVLVHSDLRSVISPGDKSSLVVFSFGGSLRVFGFERTIGNVGYRGYDIDAGFRVGPGFTFSTRETRAEKKRRFNLFMEPFLRVSFRTRLVPVLYLETGTTRPQLRFGAWIPVGARRP